MSCPRCPRCSNCHGLTSDPVRQQLELLRQNCQDRGHWISPDDRVREEAAADLIGLTPKTLRNRRYEMNPIAAYVIRRGRALYSLESIATSIVGGENYCPE